MKPLVNTPAVLLVLDGFGVAAPSRGNAVALASTPVLDRLMTSYPTMTLQAAGDAVGLPWGEMGNSEVGHISLGSGKVMYQDLPRITRSIVDGTFFQNPAFRQALDNARQHNAALHLVGMFSSAGVHSFDEHAFALLELCEREKFSDVFIHVILDGRDSAYNSGQGYVEKLQQKISSIGVGKIASVSGRYYAMDRDNHWDRIQLAYDAIALGKGPTATGPIAAIQDSYAANIFDEQFIPTVMTDQGQPVGVVGQNDSVIFFNFRSDRARELTKAFVLPGTEKIIRPAYLKDITFVTMTEYETNIPVTVAFPPEKVVDPLAKVFSQAGYLQLHAAETEKYAHVTFFFNGGTETPFTGETRVLVPSPSVTSYDQKPDMSARDITDRVIQELNTGKYAFGVVNFANPDMIGHTGNIPATIHAIETVDACVGRIVDAVLALNGLVMITADHGNAEAKIDGQTGAVNKEHSANPVPFVVISDQLPAGVLAKYRAASRDLSALTPVGILADVAPTLLGCVGLPIPESMTGHNLFANL